ncbi:hypothetical protein [Antrihabitans spumae]|uniref:Uncharacterized protein n=1 Tax=Antrihabitans spumae TaxID=3373370 RepID=A0ABW7KY66_9NOCA
MRVRFRRIQGDWTWRAARAGPGKQSARARAPFRALDSARADPVGIIDFDRESVVLFWEHDVNGVGQDDVESLRDPSEAFSGCICVFCRQAVADLVPAAVPADSTTDVLVHRVVDVSRVAGFGVDSGNVLVFFAPSVEVLRSVTHCGNPFWRCDKVIERVE